MHKKETNLARQFLMAGYGYEIRSYNNNNYSGVAPMAENWKTPSYAESDHVGRILQQPLSSSEKYIVKSERIIEQVHAPAVIEYNKISPVTYGLERNGWGAVDDRPQKVEDFITQVQTEVAQPHSVSPQLLSQGARQPVAPSPDYNQHNSYTLTEYGQPESESWSRTSSPIRDTLKERYAKVQPEVAVAPFRRPGLISDGTGRHPRDVYSPPPAAAVDYQSSYNTWSRPSSPDRNTVKNRSPEKRGFLGNMSRRPEQRQPPPPPAPVAEYKHSFNSPPKDHVTENNPWVRNSQPGLIRTTNWGQKPISTTQSAYHSYNNIKAKEMDTLRGGPECSDGTNVKHKSIMPTVPSPQPAHGAWTRPGPGGWAMTTNHATPLTRPTSDIREAVSYLTDAIQRASLAHTSPQHYYNNASGNPKMDQTIDSREAPSRYGNLNGSSTARERSFSTTIDSKEALRKYGGAAV